jgi:predicted DNA binding CopG/RHH family protein
VVLAQQETIPANGHNFENGICGGCGAEAVVITAQPKTAYAKMGETAKATVKAEGDGLTYQWYIRNADKTKYSKSSVTGPTYSCKMSEKSKDRRALCIVTDEYGNEVQTKTIVIREAASIVTEPKTTYAKSGDTAKVTIEASGDGLKYQWYIKNAGSDKYSKSTVKTDTYTVKMSDKVNGRRIRCIVTDKYGNKVETKTVLLRMSATIITQPKDVTAAKGESVQVTVEAVGTDLTYQWYIKNAGKEKFVKSSVTSATYSVKMAKKVHGRELYCVVKDKYGKSVKSDIITLSMS